MSKKDKLFKLGDNKNLSWHTFLGDSAGCGHVRVILPTLCLYQYRWKNITFMPQYGMNFVLDPNYYRNKEFTIFQRSATENHLKVAYLFKDKIQPQTGTKLFYELDDDLLDIPDWNFASQYYSKYRDTAKAIIEACDGVTVSTPTLKKKLLKFNDNVSVNINRLPKFLWGEVEYNGPIQREKPRILWQGSANHFALPGSGKEGGDFGSELLEFMRKTIDKYEWVFIGAVPNELRDLVKSGDMTQIPWQKVIEFPRKMKEMKPDLGIAPLELNEFNKSKSWIKAQEFTAAGIPAVYSHVEPYHGLKHTCKTDEEMIDTIEDLCNDEDKRKEAFDYDHWKLRDDLFFEENDNLSKYINSILKLYKKKLP